MMINEERIMTLHPKGKQGVNILRSKYDQIKDYIILRLAEVEDMSFEELADRAVADLADTFDGKVMWYVVSVKLDLEARKIIERVPRTSPHRLRMV